ncbi:MAG: hypothetical protein LBD56_00340 [Endomicrobium sp.]|jgi:hypothetical protein|nr:hypothetical protein [Endomicrobium sp.]
MKKLVLTVALCYSLGVGVAYTDIWGNIGRAVGKAWEDTKRETTKGLKSVTFSFNSDYRQEINGDGRVNTEIKISNKKD